MPNKKKGNYKAVTTAAKNNKVTLAKKGKKFKLKAKATKASGYKVKVHRKLKYESSNKKIAAVSKTGVITAKKKGTCYIYVYAQNGMYKKIKVTVVIVDSTYAFIVLHTSSVFHPH